MGRGNWLWEESWFVGLRIRERSEGRERSSWFVAESVKTQEHYIKEGPTLARIPPRRTFPGKFQKQMAGLPDNDIVGWEDGRGQCWKFGRGKWGRELGED